MENENDNDNDNDRQEGGDVEMSRWRLTAGAWWTLLPCAVCVVDGSREIYSNFARVSRGVCLEAPSMTAVEGCAMAVISSSTTRTTNPQTSSIFRQKSSGSRESRALCNLIAKAAWKSPPSNNSIYTRQLNTAWLLIQDGFLRNSMLCHKMHPQQRVIRHSAPPQPMREATCLAFV